MMFAPLKSRPPTEGKLQRASVQEIPKTCASLRGDSHTHPPDLRIWSFVTNPPWVSYVTPHDGIRNSVCRAVRGGRFHRFQLGELTFPVVAAPMAGFGAGCWPRDVSQLAFRSGFGHGCGPVASGVMRAVCCFDGRLGCPGLVVAPANGGACEVTGLPSASDPATHDLSTASCLRSV